MAELTPVTTIATNLVVIVVTLLELILRLT